MTRSIAMHLAALGMFSVGSLCVTIPTHAQSMSSYSSIPPFVTTAVAPNILLLMDNSGSMNESAYHNQNQAYDSTKSYNVVERTNGTGISSTGSPCRELRLPSGS
jgi:hypothetical protein